MVRYSMSVMSLGAFYTLRPHGYILTYLAFPFFWICARKILPNLKFRSSALICAAISIIMPCLAILSGSRPSVALWFPLASLAAVIALHLTISPLPRAALLLLLFYVCVEHYFLSRADSPHSMLFPPLVALTLPFLFDLQDGVDQGPGWALKGKMILVFFASICYFASSYDSRSSISFAQNALAMLRNGGLDPRTSDRKRILFDNKNGDIFEEIQATEFVRQRTAPCEPIYVGVTDHSKSFYNSVRAYWLSERLPGSRHVNLDAPIGSVESEQREIVRELQRNGVHWAILYNSSGTDEERLFERVSGGSKVLDQYLKTEFQEVARFGRYVIIRRSAGMSG
jgi:hypothetical protein